METSDRSNRAKTSSEAGTARKENAHPERRKLKTTYLRRACTGIVFLHYCVKIGEDTYERSPVVEQPGNEEHLNASSRDQWVL